MKKKIGYTNSAEFFFVVWCFDLYPASVFSTRCMTDRLQYRPPPMKVHSHTFHPIIPYHSPTHLLLE